MILQRLPKATLLCVVAILLNVIAAQLEVSGPWILLAFILALIGTLIAETEPALRMNRARDLGGISDDFLRLTLWALISAIIGAVTAGVFLILPLAEWRLHFGVGGVFGGKVVFWYSYGVYTTFGLIILACLSALGRQSATRLVIFGLFSATGETLVLTTFKFHSTIVTFFNSALLIVGFSVLVYSRQVVLESLVEGWGHLLPRRRQGRRPPPASHTLESGEKSTSPRIKNTRDPALQPPRKHRQEAEPER